LTLRQWRERFLSRLPEVRALGFDTRFIRMWEYYLAVCEAGFLTRNTGDLQIGFSKLPVGAELRGAAGARGAAMDERAPVPVS
jgi:Mycolic acid cyclopropane synthetase